MSKYEPSREELEAFIARAGFRWGWENLESAARRMAEHACIELHDAHLAAQSEWPSEGALDAIREVVADMAVSVPRKSGSVKQELVAGWHERLALAMQSVRPPVGVVSDGTDIFDSAKQVGAEIDGGDAPDYQSGFPGSPPTITFTDRQLERFVWSLQPIPMRKVGVAEYDPENSGFAAKARLEVRDVPYGAELYAVIASRHAPTKD